MTGAELLEALLELARAAGLEVRVVGIRQPHDLPPPESGVCRVRGRLWVVLSSADPVEDQLEVMAGALRDHARPYLESHYLAPAVRQRLDPTGELLS